MTLMRSTFRAKAIEILTAAAIVPANKIFRARAWPIKPEDYPAILVFTPSEDQENKGDTADPAFLSRPSLAFEIGVKGDTGEACEDACDALCESVVESLMTNPDLIALVERVVSIKTTMEEHEGQYQYHRARIVFTYEYTEVYPPVIPNLLDLIDAKVVGPQGDVLTEMRITPQSS
jgi:hypothetical protein